MNNRALNKRTKNYFKKVIKAIDLSSDTCYIYIRRCETHFISSQTAVEKKVVDTTLKP